MLKAVELSINHVAQPMGLDKTPKFSWILESDLHDVMQTGYWMQISENADFVTTYFECEATSEQSTDVCAEGLKLESASCYFWRVRVSANGEKSEWSETAAFTTGYLSASEWQGSFVSAETDADAGVSKGTYIRRNFVSKNNVKNALLFCTALGLYKAYLNGEKIGTDEFAPGWTSYNKHLLYQTYDVTDMLRDGENALGASLGAGWYKGKMGFSGFRNHYGNKTAFLCDLVITYLDGSREVISTDEAWRGADSPILFSEIYDGETYDARLEIDGWNKPDFNADGWRSVGKVDFDKTKICAQYGCTVKQIDTIPVKELIKTPQGDTVLDFGQNLTGWVAFTAQGATGDTVELNCFETLDGNGNVYIENLRGAKETITYTFRDDKPVSFHPSFSFQGFRYVKVAKWPGKPSAGSFTAQTVHSDMRFTGDFSCDNALVNQLHHNIIWSMKGNFLDVPTDCPQRNERLGWTGDAQIFARTASYIANTYPFFDKWLTDLEADQTPEGGVAHVVPDIITGKEGDDKMMNTGTHSAAAWADAAVIIPWALYLTFGDKTILSKQYGSMKRWIDFMSEHAVDGIWNYRLQFGDWVALDAEEGSYFGATPNDLTCTAYYAYSTGLFARIAKILKNDNDADKYSALYERIRGVFQKTFFNADGSMTAQTQTAHIVALYFGLVPEEFRQKTVDGLLKLLNKENGHLVTGFVGTPYFCHALSQNGCAEQAYELLLKEDFPSWLYQVKMGATTIWEHWDGLKPDGSMWSADMNSFNHYAYGAVGEWLYRAVAGIEADENAPGYKHSIIYPRVSKKLGGACAHFDSVYGRISVKWTMDEQNKVSLNVRIPHNTTATIILDDAKTVENGGGLAFERKNGLLQASAGSGEYSIVFNK